MDYISTLTAVDALSVNQKKWLRHYFSLIQKYSCKKQKGQTEAHHIIPESFFKNRTRNPNRPGFLDGDPNCKANIVHLSQRAHFIAHLLLLKIFPNDQSMICAAHLMAAVNGAHYQWLKRRWSKHLSSPEAKIRYAEIGKSLTGDKNPAKRKEVREKISKSLSGKKAAPEAIAKNSHFRKGKNKTNYEPIARMAKTISQKYEGLTKENSAMRRNHSASLSISMSGKTKHTCKRVANASKTLSETMSVIKKAQCIDIVKAVNSGKTLREIFQEHKTTNEKITRLKQVQKAYDRGIAYLAADKTA